MSAAPPERFRIECQNVHRPVSPSSLDPWAIRNWYGTPGIFGTAEEADDEIRRRTQHPYPGTWRRHRIIRQVGFAQRPHGPAAGTWWFKSDVLAHAEQPWPADLPVELVRPVALR